MRNQEILLIPLIFALFIGGIQANSSSVETIKTL